MFASAGVVDEDYRGNVGVVLFNFSKDTFEGELWHWNDSSPFLSRVPAIRCPYMLFVKWDIIVETYMFMLLFEFSGRAWCFNVGVKILALIYGVFSLPKATNINHSKHNVLSLNLPHAHVDCQISLLAVKSLKGLVCACSRINEVIASLTLKPKIT